MPGSMAPRSASLTSMSRQPCAGPRSTRPKTTARSLLTLGRTFCNMAQRLETRASVTELIKAEGLGQTPFSHPENFYMYQSETA